MSQPRKAIDRGIVYLRSVQGEDGAFSTQLSEAQRPFTASAELSTTFLPALMLGALSSVEGTEGLRNKLATWLLNQKNNNWSFNYWPAKAQERTSRPYPDDLDDTCCALIGLYLHDPKIIDSACLAKVVRLLVAAEQEVGGPYKTWLVPKTAPAAWQDVDIAVNCNVAYLLRLVAKPLPKLDALMERAITTQQFESPYYPIHHIVLYYLARAYQGDRESQLASIIVKEQKNGNWETPGQTALALSALAHLGRDEFSAAIQYLLSQQRADGSWPAEAMWLDEKQVKKSKYAGSPALTTAFVLEALVCSKPLVPVVAKDTPDKSSQDFLRIINRANSKLGQLDNPLRQHAQEMLAKLQQGTTGREIVLLPAMFADALTDRPNISSELQFQLSLANIFGWMAYTIYDDFLDEEGSLSLLPVANVAMRESLACFTQALPNDADFQQQVHKTFTRIDTANAWEVEHCRYQTDGQTMYVSSIPDYVNVEYLAERSLGHGLTPLAILLAVGIPSDDLRIFYFKKAFRHYLAARQLHDDLHDWQQDFRKGHVSYVVAHLLKELHIPPGRHICRALLSQLEHQFWHHSLRVLCEQLRRQLALSRQAYHASLLLNEDSPFSQLLYTLENAVTRTLQEQQKAIQFLKAYRQKQ